MTHFARSISSASTVRALCWLTLSAIISVIIAVTPTAASALVIGFSALLVLSLITPFAPLTALLVIAPIRTLFATESPIQIPLDVGQWLLIAALGAWALRHLVMRAALPRIRLSTPLIAALIFTIAGALSAFTAYSLDAWLTEWLKWVQIAMLIVLVADLGQRRMWEWLVFALVASALTNALIGIYEFFGGSGAEHLLIRPDWGYFRAFGTFGQPNPFGGFMGLIAPLATAAAFGYALQAWTLYRHSRVIAFQRLGIAMFYAVSAALISAALFMSWSRGAWLGFGISMLVVVFAAPRNLKVGALILAGMIMLSGLLWASGRLPASIVERIESATQETFSFTDVRGVDINPENYPLVERLAHWQAAINMAHAHPILGVGLGNYETAYPLFRLIYWKYPLGHAHNYYLNVLAETGIIGLTAYLCMWLIIAVVTWRTIRRQPDTLARSIAVGLLGTWVYLAIHSLTDNLYVNNLFVHLGLMLGILSVLSARTRMVNHSERIAWHNPIPSI